MGYEVGITTSAVKDLDGLPSKVRQRVTAAIDALADNPRPSGVTKLKGGTGLYRVRVGEYRVTYRINDAEQRVSIARAEHRRDVYRRSD